jgi:3-oxoadipate enol-lactonase
MTIRPILRGRALVAELRPQRSRLALPGRLPTWLSLTLAAGMAVAQPSADADFGQPSMIDTRAGRLAVFEVGHGPKVVIYWSSIFADHSMYRFQASGLGPDYRQVFIDGPGHGASGRQTPGATLETHADAVIQVMDRIGIARATFVGTSWGGLVGALVARDHPDRLRTLVALNAPFETREGGPSFGDRMTVWAAGLFGNVGFFADGAAKAFFSKTTLSQHPERVESFKSRFPAFDRQALGPVLRVVMLDRQSELPWLHRILVPVLVVAGKDDPAITPEQARRAARLIPSAKFVLVESAGHLSALEAPESINPLIVAAAQ